MRTKLIDSSAFFMNDIIIKRVYTVVFGKMETSSFDIIIGPTRRVGWEEKYVIEQATNEQITRLSNHVTMR